jgi:hypothetical protein
MVIKRPSQNSQLRLVINDDFTLIKVKCRNIIDRFAKLITIGTF